jgi:hypothetical protein
MSVKPLGTRASAGSGAAPAKAPEPIAPVTLTISTASPIAIVRVRNDFMSTTTRP